MVEKISEGQQAKVRNESHSKRRDVMLCYTVRQLEEPKTQLYIHTSVNLELSTRLKALKEAEEPKMSCAGSRSPSLLRQPLNFWRGLKSQTQEKKKHLLKGFCHFLGLSKPKKLICPPHSCVVYSRCSGFSYNLQNNI